MGIDLLNRLGFQIIHKSDSQSISAVCNNPSSSNSILREFPELLKPGGYISGYEHKPRILTTVHPVSQPQRRLPLALQPMVEKKLREMEADGIIEKIDSSEWVSNMVVVKKSDGDIRICCDLSSANKAVVADKFPLPTMEELSRDLAGSKYFSKIDLKGAYLQVRLADSARDLTAMITPIGLYRWKRLPFGLSSAPSAFQKIITDILTGCEGARNLLDDLIICGSTLPEHDQRLRAVLHALTKHNVKLNADKCIFGVTELDFVGHHISGDGITPLQSNVDSLLSIPSPKNQKQLRQFLGAANYYLKFVENFASTAEPLRHLLKMDVQFDWSSDCQS